MNKGRKRLAINTMMLYVLTLSNYVFAFITVPYLTRVLGPALYGVIGFAVATMTYFQLIIDFGFILSATADITKNKNDKNTIARIFTSVTVAKLLLAIICSLILFSLCLIIPQIREYPQVFALYMCYTICNALLPDFLYRGMENMKPITYRTVSVKLIMTLSIFILVKSSEDLIMVPLLYMLGSLLAVVIAYIDIHKRFEVKIIKIKIEDVVGCIKKSAPFFISRIASTVYGATNTFLLGLVYPGQPVVGYYTSADKIVAVARAGASPIADSLYPYLINKRDFSLVRKIIKVLMPIIIFMGVLLFIFAPEICILLFGKLYVDSSIALRALVPTMVLVLPNYIMGFPMMTPLGIEKKANISIVYGACLQIVIIAGLWLTGWFSMLTVCISTSITEASIFMYRSIAVWKKLKNN